METAKTRFKKMYYKLPQEARRELVYNYSLNPMSLNVCFHEINNNTEIGKKILRDLGYTDNNQNER